MYSVISQQLYGALNQIFKWTSQHPFFSVAILIAVTLNGINLWCDCILFGRIRAPKNNNWSSIWLAICLIPPRLVVWKRVNLRGLNREEKKERLGRFIREIDILTKIEKARRYKFVVRIIRNRIRSYTMEYLPQDMQKWLKMLSKKSNPNGEQALAVFLCIGIQICKGLRELYNIGVEAHRDLKPTNVMIVKITFSPKVKVHIKIIDMGIIKMPDDTLETRERGMGTLFYMAPECYENARKADNRADVFSLCVILWRLITYFARVEQRTEKEIIQDLGPGYPLNWDKFCSDLNGTFGRALQKYQNDNLNNTMSRLQDLIGQGLNVEREKRPDFDEFQNKLQSIYGELCASAGIQIRDPLDISCPKRPKRPKPFSQEETAVILPSDSQENIS
ncbi:protein kinase [Candidatus Poribacteria bacterium]|nr:protein kinase [Candidatus Poribacteria bacterium]